MDRQQKSIPSRVRFAVLREAGFRCQYCGRGAPQVLLHVDHRIPRALGGTNDPSNLVASCATCNVGKGAEPLSAGQ